MVGDIDAAVGRLGARRSTTRCRRDRCHVPAGRSGEQVHRHAARARGAALASNPLLDGVKGESRHAVSIYKDPDLVAGFPLFLGNSGEGSPKIARPPRRRQARDRVRRHRRQGARVSAPTAASSPAGRSRPRRCRSSTPRTSNHAQGARRSRARSIPRATRRPAPPPPSATSTATASRRSSSPPGSAASGPGTPTAASSRGFPVQLDRDTVAVAKDREPRAAGRLLRLAGARRSRRRQEARDHRRRHGRQALRVARRRQQASPTSRCSSPIRPACRSSASASWARPPSAISNSDGVPDIVVGSNEDYSTSGRALRRRAARPARSCPAGRCSIVSNHILPVVGKGVPCAPAMADVDGDDVPEVLVSGIGSVLQRVRFARQEVRPARSSTSSAKYGDKSNATQRHRVHVRRLAGGRRSRQRRHARSDRRRRRLRRAARVRHRRQLRHDFEHHVGAWDGKTRQATRTAFRASSRIGSSSRTRRSPTSTATASPRCIAPSAGYFVHAWNVDGVEAKGFPSTPAAGRWRRRRSATSTATASSSWCR